MPDQLLGPELMDEIVLGSARGGAKPQLPLSVEVVRSLVEADVEILLSPPPVDSSAPVIRQLKHQHHRLAQLISQGVDGTEISLITGYSPAYVSTLKTGPDFQELITYYAAQETQKHVDAMARLHALGLSGVEELAKRIEEEPEKWTKRELMELVEMGLLTPAAVKQQSSGGSAGSQPLIQVNFIGREAEGSGEMRVIEGEVVKP